MQLYLNANAAEAAKVFAIRGGGAAALFLSYVLMARWMGQAEFGRYSYAWSWIVVLAPICQWGFSSTSTRVIAAYRQNGQFADCTTFIAFVGCVVVGISCLAMAAGTVILYGLAPGLAREYADLSVIAAACLPMLALQETGKGVLRGFGLIMSAYMPVYLVRPLLLNAILATALFLGVKMNAHGALSAYFLVLSVLCAIQWRQAFNLARSGLSREPLRHAWAWLLSTTPVAIADFEFMLLAQIDLLMVGYYFGPEELASYFAAGRVAVLLSFVHFAVSAASSEPLARLQAQNDAAGVQRQFKISVGVSLLASALGAGFLLLLGSMALSWFGSAYVHAFPILTVLLAGLFVQGAMGPTRTFLTMTGRQTTVLLVVSASIAANIGLNLLLIPPMGAMGAALASAVSLAGMSLGLFVPVARATGIYFNLKSRPALSS